MVIAGGLRHPGAPSPGEVAALPPSAARGCGGSPAPAGLLACGSAPAALSSRMSPCSDPPGPGAGRTDRRLAADSCWDSCRLEADLGTAFPLGPLAQDRCDIRI